MAQSAMTFEREWFIYLFELCIAGHSKRRCLPLCTVEEVTFWMYTHVTLLMPWIDSTCPCAAIFYCTVPMSCLLKDSTGQTMYSGSVEQHCGWGSVGLASRSLQHHHQSNYLITPENRNYCKMAPSISDLEALELRGYVFQLWIFKYSLSIIIVCT